MTSKLTGRIIKVEKRTAPVDIAKWMHLPVREMPDWVLCTIILGRTVGPAEAGVLDKDKEFGWRLEALCATGEGTDEQHAIRRDLIDYVERDQHRARLPVGSSERVH